MQQSSPTLPSPTRVDSEPLQGSRQPPREPLSHQPHEQQDEGSQYGHEKGMGVVLGRLAANVGVLRADQPGP